MHVSPYFAEQLQEYAGRPGGPSGGSWNAGPAAASSTRICYRRRRDNHADWHAAAQRNLFNRMIGQLYHCLHHGERFGELAEFPAPPATTETAAA